MVEVAVKKYMVKFVVENVVDDKIIKKNIYFIMLNYMSI
jgi:hypothetical protein